MTMEEVIHEAIQHGNNIGQTALAKFILRDYGHVISYDLKRFLEKVTETCYDGIGEAVGKPAEDIALQVEQVMATK